MFTFNPELAHDDAYDEGDEVFDSYSKNEEDDDDTQVRLVFLDFNIKVSLLLK